MSRWYRAYSGTITDSKIGEVALIAECSRSVVIATWHAILESCAEVQERGRYDITPRRVAAALGEPVALIERVYDGLSETGMIAGDVVCAWTKRQFESDNSTQRSQRHRATKRNVDATLPQQEETSPSVSVSVNSKAQSEKVSAPDEALFQRLLIACPKREGSNPHRKARERFARAIRDGDDPEDIISAASAWKAREAKLGNEGTRFVRRIDVWLNEAEWRDVEPEPPQIIRPPPIGEFIEHDSARWHEVASHLRNTGKIMPPAIHTKDGKRGAYVASSREEAA